MRDGQAVFSSELARGTRGVYAAGILLFALLGLLQLSRLGASVDPARPHDHAC